MKLLMKIITFNNIEFLKIFGDILILINITLIYFYEFGVNVKGFYLNLFEWILLLIAMIGIIISLCYYWEMFISHIEKVLDLSIDNDLRRM